MQELCSLLKKLDISAADTQILLRCAPLIAGIRISNLLIIQDAQADYVRQLFKKQEGKFASAVLYSGEGKTVLLLYRHQELNAYLTLPEVKKMLYQAGYRDFAMQALVDAFSLRFASFREKKGIFPHEMGLFLGYPAEDVKGFIENKGKNALYSGYWKVYRNPAQKQHLFHVFDLAREGLIRLAARGICMEDILQFSPGLCTCCKVRKKA